MTDEEIRAIVRDAVNEEFGHGPRQVMCVYGRCSKKMIGELVGEALLHSPIVIIDGRGLRAVSSHKVMWKLEDGGDPG